jgi:hypothetical protein
MFLISVNIEEIFLEDLARSVLVSVLIGIMFLGGMRLLLKDWNKAGLYSTLLLFILFSYGHLYDQISGFELLGILFTRNRLLIGGYAILAALVVVLEKKWVKNYQALSKLGNLISVVLILFPIYSIGSSYFQGWIHSQKMRNAEIETALPNTIVTESLPDIYYIILDGYGRNDVFQELYDFDNKEFLNFLEARGFYTAQNSYTNYTRTLQSLASSLNFRYLDELNGMDTKSERPFDNLIKENQVSDILRLFDYQFVYFETGIRTNTFESDYLFDANNSIHQSVWGGAGINDFETLFIDTTLLGLFTKSNLFLFQTMEKEEEAQTVTDFRNRIYYNLTHIPEAAKWDGNYFVFAHIISPHPPFVFDSEGNPLTPEENISLLGDGDTFPNGPEAYIARYVAQLQFVNTQIEEAVDKIIKYSDTPPIIIIQGDHGPGAYLVWESLENSNIKERTAILNSYYFPNGDNGMLYNDISPVNSFRVVFNRYFGYDFDLLPDRSFFILMQNKYDFQEVTGQLK